jgi:pSer/pThr/pTyr-binding forkhead associated (FHA) protein
MSDGHVIKLRLSLMGRPVRNYTFEKPVISVGRDPGADVYVDNPGVSRDHFRLERSQTGEYQVVDLGSANGTFVNDQMINTSLVHNNDVIRFGKYTLWVGYEQDRRTQPRDGRATVSPVTETAGHTVVLSRAEIGSILDKERRLETTGVKSPKVVTLNSGASERSGSAPARTGLPAWAAILLGLVLGVLVGAGALWLVMQRPTIS